MVENSNDREQNEYKLMFDTLKCGVCKNIFDRHFTVLWANNYFFEILGLTREIFSRNYHDRCDEYLAYDKEMWIRLMGIVQSTIRNGRNRFYVVERLHLPPDKLLPVTINGFITNELHDGYRVVYTTLAPVDYHIDHSCGKPVVFMDGSDDRRRFLKTARANLSGGDMYSIVSLNISSFKLLNDWFGYGAGDEVLNYVRHTIENCLTDSEAACRANADNFYLFLKGNAAEVKTRLLAIIDRVNLFTANTSDSFILRFNAGICSLENSSENLESSLKKADLAMLKSKTDAFCGACRCRTFTAGEYETLLKKKDIEEHMEDALLKGEFLVYYQPKIRLKDKIITGAEALVRWQDPRYGLIAPDSFIPCFEENGFIVKLDLFVFTCVCALIRKWLDAGLAPIPISVNMSRVHLKSGDFMQPYEEIRRRYAVPSSLLEIELTETIAAGGSAILIDAINYIKSFGYGCALDDFGSGYSSLNILKDADFDVIKLDKQFLAAKSKICSDKDKYVVRKIIELAKALKMQTVAEGVETDCQTNFLLDAECDFAQGFRFYRPQPVTELEKSIYGKA